MLRMVGCDSILRLVFQRIGQMAQLSKYRVLIAGVLSPLAAPFLYVLVYSILKRASSDLEKDWLLRLSVSTLAMILPFLVTLVLAIKDRRQHALSLSGK